MKQEEFEQVGEFLIRKMKLWAHGEGQYEFLHDLKQWCLQGDWETDYEQYRRETEWK